MLGKVFKCFIILIFSIICICCLRTYLLNLQRSKHLPPCEVGEDVGYISVNEEMWRKFRDILKIPTISYRSGVYEEEEFLRFHEYVFKSYPRIFNTSYINYEVVNRYSLLIEVKGLNKNLLPYILAAHIDVVPVDQAKWTVDAFGAVEKDGILYGRGTMDDKATLTSLLEVVDYIIRTDKRPQRGFFIALGHDEEVRGQHGAQKINQALKKRGVNKLHFILDEGFNVIRNIAPYINKELAIVGVAEKGYMTLNISISLEGGHSSMPDKDSALTIMAKAVTRLEESGFPAVINKVVESQILGMSFASNFPYNIILSNTWLFKPLIKRAFCEKPHTRAMVQTVGSVTMFNSGIKANVIPTSAWAIINFRIHSSDSNMKVLEHVRRTINDDRVKIKVLQNWDHHPISPHDEKVDLPYQVIHDTIGQIFPDAPVVPAVLIANTDCAHYLDLTDAIYRFQPIQISVENTRRYHGHDEFTTHAKYEKQINFFRHLMVNAERTHLRTESHHDDL